MNEELINSAVSFLQDEKVAASPINKKIEFLQSKGLNDQEVDEAIKRAGNLSATVTEPQRTAATTYKQAIQERGNSPNSQNSQNNHNYAPLDYYPLAPPLPDRTWKDYFIMATATAGVTYGFYQVVSRYLLPSILPPGRTRLEEDKQVVEDEFVKIDKVLEQMAAEQNEVKEANETKLKEIDAVLNNVNEYLEKSQKDKQKFDDDLRLMKLEVDTLQNTVVKNMKLTKDNILDELKDIVSELESLKNLIKARGSSAGAPERKVAPVSSIPSASEILKKAKANGGAVKAPVQNGNANASGPEKTQPDSSELKATEAAVESKPLVAPQTKRPSFSAQEEYHAAGIPDWQLAHKKREQEAAEKSAGNSKVQESILKVGVPQWQLNASLK